MSLFAPFAFIKEEAIAAPPGPYVPVNAEVVAWVTATGITTDPLIEAVDDFVTGCKDDGFWGQFDAVWPFVTDSTDTATIKDQFKYNLVDTSTYTLLYTGSSTVGYGGYTNGGAGAGLNTQWIPSSNNYHLSIYTTTGAPNADVIDMAGVRGNSAYTYFIVGRNDSGAGAQQLFSPRTGDFDCNLSGQTIQTGHFIGTSNVSASPVSLFFRRGTQIDSSTKTAGTRADRFIYIGAANNDGTIINATSKQFQFSSVGDPLTSTECSDFTTRVNTLQSAVDAIYATSRAV